MLDSINDVRGRSNGPDNFSFCEPHDPDRPPLARASKARPCPVCGRGDWCSIFADGSAAICMRMPSEHPTANGGHVHRLADRPLDVRKVGRFAGFLKTAKRYKAAARATPTPLRDPADLLALHRRHDDAASAGRVGELANDLGVTPDALRRVRVGWSGRAYSFAMFDAAGRVTGLRYRHPASGSKWSERGGLEGVFAPAGILDATPAATIPALLIVEGPTDLAALLDLLAESADLARCAAIGRPSCTGGSKIIRNVVARLRPCKVAVLADADPPGRRGADALARALAADAVPVRVVAPPPPSKDIRAWRVAGATGRDLLDLLRSPGVPANPTPSTSPASPTPTAARVAATGKGVAL